MMICRVLFVLCLSLAPLSASAEEQSEFERWQELLEKSTEALLGDIINELGPELVEMMEGLNSLRGYHAPEVLPNGDIIIRRRKSGDIPEGEVEL